jgi:hypothetical protein
MVKAVEFMFWGINKSAYFTTQRPLASTGIGAVIYLAKLMA